MKRKSLWTWGVFPNYIKRRVVQLLWQSYVAWQDGNGALAHDIQRFLKDNYEHVIGDERVESIIAFTLRDTRKLRQLKAEFRV